MPKLLMPGVKTNIGASLLAQNSAYGWHLSGPIASKSIQGFTTQLSSGDTNVSHFELLESFWIYNTAQNSVFGWSLSGPIAGKAIHTFTTQLSSGDTHVSLLKSLSEQKDVPNHPPSLPEQETYVDDVLAGGQLADDACDGKSQLIRILSSAEFPLQEITAYHPKQLEDVAPSYLLDAEFLKFTSAHDAGGIQEGSPLSSGEKRCH